MSASTPRESREYSICRSSQGRAELDAKDELIAGPAAEGLGDEQLVVAHAVEVGGVEEGDPGVEGGPQGGEALLAVGGAVARRRSFRAAAIERGVSPSALSQAVRDLEEQIGARLLHRTTHSVSPTEAGRKTLTGRFQNVCSVSR